MTFQPAKKKQEENERDKYPRKNKKKRKKKRVPGEESLGRRKMCIDTAKNVGRTC
jgi:hypothetical protein